MPELPEVEAVRRALAPVMVGAAFIEVETRRPDLRAPFATDFTSRLVGQVVRSLTRRGKYLLAHLSSSDTLVMHLGMSGSFRVETDKTRDLPGGYASPRNARAIHDHVVFHMSAGATITFNDPRRFGFMAIVSHDELSQYRGLGSLGPEPLSRGFNAALLARACAGKHVSLKVALLDQRVVTGLGNIYVCEALHRAGLSPRRRASTIATSRGMAKESARRLAAAIKKVLSAAVHPDARDRFRVYGREGERCRRPGCTGGVRRIVQAGRSTFFCAVCQRA